MIDLKVLTESGLTEDRLKAIFTSKNPGTGMGDGTSMVEGQERAFPTDGTNDSVTGVDTYPKNPEDWQIREFFENRIRSRIYSGIERAIKGNRINQAVDIAMDGTLINRSQLPLQLLAQGYITVDSCRKQIDKISPDLAAEIFETNPGGSVIKVNTPKLFEVSHNLVHSLTTRRVASVSTPVRQRYPMLKYESRNSSMTGQLKSDLMTQYAEIMVDNYGYRHSIEQTVRDLSCYSHQIEFIVSPWDKREQELYVRKPKTGADDAGDEGNNYEKKTVIEKEGVDFIAPHPSRVYTDPMFPLSKINSDTGGTYLGYWDISKLGDLKTNPDFYNRDELVGDGGIYELTTGNENYFRFYYNEQIAMPDSNRYSNPGLNNDRQSNAAEFSQASDDTPITLAYHFEKINPKQWGISSYDHDVWIRFIVAGSQTVVWADICGSTPAIYYGYNESDSRELSPSFASLVIPYQDQISNLLTQLLEIQHQGLIRIYALNKDGISKDNIQKIENALTTKNYTQAGAIILGYSAESMRDIGVAPSSQYAERLRSIEVSTSEKTNEIFKSIMSLLSMAERLLFFSPQELGQVAPREISATEANIVNNTTLGIRDFHSIGLEEGLDTKKKIIYESSMAFGSDAVELSTLNSYSRETVESAGFTVTGIDREGNYEIEKTGRFTLSGSAKDLIHNYSFTSRDGTERTPSSAVAQASVQLLEVIGRYPSMSQAITLEQGVELINGVARQLGVPMNLKVPEGSNPSDPMSGNPQEQFQQFAQTVQEALQALAGKVDQQEKGQQSLAQAVTQIAQFIQKQPTAEGEVAPGVPRGAPPLESVPMGMEPPAL